MTEIDTALGLLQDAVDKEIALSNGEAAKAAGIGNFDRAQKQINTSKELTAFKKQVSALHKAYKNIRSSCKKSPRAQRGTITPERAYSEPILQALKEMGGQGETAKVIDRVGELMRPILKETDYEKLGSGSIRWRNKCEFARARLIGEGKLRDDSPRGIWELVEP